MQLPESENLSKWIIGLAGAVGAALFKLFEFFVKRRFSETDDIRKELRADVAQLNLTMRNLQVELDTWKGKYFELAASSAELKAECLILREKIEQLKGTAVGRS